MNTTLISRTTLDKSTFPSFLHAKTLFVYNSIHKKHKYDCNFVLKYAGVFWLRVDSKSRFPMLAVSAASVIPVAIPNPAIRFWGFQGCY